ncbi:nickel/cobalt transporter [Leptospira interrogans]
MPAMTSRSQLLLIVALAGVTILATQPAYATEQSVGVFGGIWQFVLEGQRELTNGMTAAVRQIKSGNIIASGAVLALISFLYGILHAVGPGHGKFVISSYALANERTVRRGILLSFMAAFVQAISAIVIVGILAVILNATSVQLRVTESWLETASWGLIALLGAWLLYGQIRRVTAKPQQAAQDAHHHHDHDHTHDHHHAHDHEHADDGSCCGHTHVAAPSQLQGQWSWSRAWALAFSIGIRPCTGAIGVLVFSLGMGIFWAGVFATFAMAIGTAITVSVLASLAVGSRELAARLGGGADSRWAHRIQAAAGLGGSALVMILGASFFFASLNGMSPL